MALLQVDFYSDALGRGAQLCALLPGGAPPAGGFPTLYLLHGLSDDYSIWTRRTSIERYADEKRLAVIMPDTRRCWYANTHAGERYFDHISDEVVRFSRRMLPGLSHRREDTFVAGLSMGGYGALRCALGRPDVFSKAASLSGSPEAPTRPRQQESDERVRYWEDTFGPLKEAAGSAHDLYHAAEKLKEIRPAIWMWCGTEDSLHPANLRLRDHLHALDYDLTYSEGPGDHQWKYWDAQIQNVLEWLIPAEEVGACR